MPGAAGALAKQPLVSSGVLGFPPPLRPAPALEPLRHFRGQGSAKTPFQLERSPSSLGASGVAAGGFARSKRKRRLHEPFGLLLEVHLRCCRALETLRTPTAGNVRRQFGVTRSRAGAEVRSDPLASCLIHPSRAVSTGIRSVRWFRSRSSRGRSGSPPPPKCTAVHAGGCSELGSGWSSLPRGCGERALTGFPAKAGLPGRRLWHP